MKNYNIYFVLLILFFGLSLSCNNVNAPKIDGEYPTKLYPIDSLELEQLKSECPYEIDEYGLISFSGIFLRGKSDIKDSNLVVDMSKKTLVQYSKFSNVFSESSLSLKEVSNYNPTPLPTTDWTVIFKNQIYEGLEVLNTEIITIVHNNVASIKGHYFNNIFVPIGNIMPIEKIKENLVGKKFEYNCNGPREIEITAEIISDDVTKNIYWKEIGSHIEFRVVWRIPILSDGLQKIRFYLLVDVISGEILYVQQTFIC